MKNLFYCTTCKLRILAICLLFIFSCSFAYAAICGSMEEPDLMIQKDEAVHAVANENGIVDSILSLDFFLGIGASCIAALILLILYYITLRPRFTVMPFVALLKSKANDKEDEQSCQIVIKNKSVFPVCKIQIELSVEQEYLNDDQRSNVFNSQTCMYLDGKCGDENKSDLLVNFTLPKNKLPRELKLAIFGQHALSGNSLPTEHSFKIDDFRQGHYEKSIFIKEGLSFRQAVLRLYLQRIPIVIVVALCILGLLGVILFIFSSLSMTKNILIFGGVCLLMSLLIIAKGLYVIIRVSAYSKEETKQIIKALVLNLLPTQSNSNSPSIEDVEGEDVTKKKK